MGASLANLSVAYDRLFIVFVFLTKFDSIIETIERRKMNSYC